MKKPRFLAVCVALLATTLNAYAQNSRLVVVLPSGKPNSIVSRLSEALARQNWSKAGLAGDQLTLLRRDSASLANMNVPLSALPLLAVGRYDAEGKLIGFDWNTWVRDPKQAVSELDTYVQAQLAQARIDSATMRPSVEGKAVLEAGDRVNVEVHGTPGATATARVGGVSGIPLQEVSPGVYQGFYQVRTEDRADADVSVDLVAGATSQNAQLGRITLQGLRQPAVTTVEQQDTAVWRVRGTAPPNSKVQVHLDIDEAGDTDFETVADAQGNWSQDLDVGRWIPSSAARFQVKAQSGDGNLVVSPEQNVTFSSKDALRPRVAYYPGFGGMGLGLGWGWGYPGLLGGGWGFPGYWGGGGWGGGWGGYYAPRYYSRGFSRGYSRGGGYRPCR